MDQRKTGTSELNSSGEDVGSRDISSVGSIVDSAVGSSVGVGCGSWVGTGVGVSISAGSFGRVGDTSCARTAFEFDKIGDENKLRTRMKIIAADDNLNSFFIFPHHVDFIVGKDKG
jgi:hypothetical protein